MKMNRAELLEEIAAAIVTGIKAATDPMARTAGLEQRIKHLESRPLLKWAGVHQEGQRYAEAQLVTRSGSLWVSTTDTDTTPGAEASGWRLIVKGR